MWYKLTFFLLAQMGTLWQNDTEKVRLSAKQRAHKAPFVPALSKWLCRLYSPGVNFNFKCLATKLKELGSLNWNSGSDLCQLYYNSHLLNQRYHIIFLWHVDVFRTSEVLPLIKRARWKVLSTWKLSKKGNISKDGDLMSFLQPIFINIIKHNYLYLLLFDFCELLHHY